MFSRSTPTNCNGQKEADASRSRLEKNPLKRLLARLSEDHYRPEKHYMRGPGPKAKAKAMDAEGGEGTAAPRRAGTSK